MDEFPDDAPSSSTDAPATSASWWRFGRKRVRVPLMSRLVGLETEYATLVANRPELPTADLPASAIIYANICAAIRRDQPTVPGVFDPDQMFLASGGAVTFESHPSLHAIPGGLIEIATPEVTSPNELLACQRSIDELVSEAASKVGGGVDLRVLKNSTDALGHVYGCQENYETDVASGIWLIVYRCFVALLWLLQVVSLLAALPVIAIAFAAILLIKIRRHPLQESEDSPEHQIETFSAGDLFESLPSGVKSCLMGMLRLVHFPTVLTLKFVARHIAFRKQRRYLEAMLVSRVALCGAGNLDHQGRYQLSPKAMAIDAVADMGGYNGERPIFVYGHWLGHYCAKSFLSLGATREMFSRRQRLQIGLSDSNLSELAEYVKVASVSLVLDMIESGYTSDFVILNRPIDALHEIASDWNLVRRVMTNRGRMSALEIQQRYFKSASQFVRQNAADIDSEAQHAILRWGELLDVVAAFRKDARNTIPALGRVDWLSKRWMIDQLGKNAAWVAKKKTDLRYHELSHEGYYRKLIAMNPSLTLVHQDQVDRRRRTPPADSPATKRGWLIREFAGGEDALVAEWRYAILGEGREKKKIDFS